MKPTKEQLSSRKWWDFYVGNNNYCYWQESTKSIWGYVEKPSKKKVFEHKIVLLAKRPEVKLMPKIGGCEVKLGAKWVKCKVDYVSDRYAVVKIDGTLDFDALRLDHYEFRPLRTQREELVDIIEANLEANVGLGDIAGVILARFELTEKD